MERSRERAFRAEGTVCAKALFLRKDVMASMAGGEEGEAGWAPGPRTAV